MEQICTHVTRLSACLLKVEACLDRYTTYLGYYPSKYIGIYSQQQTYLCINFEIYQYKQICGYVLRYVESYQYQQTCRSILRYFEIYQYQQTIRYILRSIIPLWIGSFICWLLSYAYLFCPGPISQRFSTEINETCVVQAVLLWVNCPVHVCRDLTISASISILVASICASVFMYVSTRPDAYIYIYIWISSSVNA